MAEAEEPYRYPIRITERAEADIKAAYQWFALREGTEIAEEWRRGLFDATAPLSSPIRPLAQEQQRFTIPVRFITYRRTRNSTPYRVLFTIVENDLDPPFVRLFAVRHGAQDAITTDEARDIEAGA